MISRRLRYLTLLAGVLLVAHAVEEWWTRMYLVDPFFRAAERLSGGPAEAAFLAFQAMWCLCLLILILMIQGERWRLWVLRGFAILLIAESQHLWLALYNRGYHPGAVTSGLILLVGVLYWKELLVLRRRPIAHR